MKFSILALSVTLLTACASTPRNPNPLAAAPVLAAASVDLDRYIAGRWYVIANIPYFAERGDIASYVEYSRRPDGQLNDWYYFRDGSFNLPHQKKEGIARVLPDSNNARWEVQFQWPVWSDYVVLYVDADYQYAVIGHPSKDYGWIFSREARMTDDRYAELLGVLEANGYDTRRLLKIPQVADQLGAPGFQ